MKFLKIIVLLLLVSATAVKAQKPVMENAGVMIESASKFGFDETLAKLTANITEKGWKVTIVHDLQETMKKNGKEVLPVKVIELCNPAHAFNILSKDEYRDVTPMLPCRISVYEKADGKTYISRMNAPAFAAMIGGDAAKTMVQAFSETEVIIDVVME